MKSLRFDNRVLKRLPIDPEKQNFVREVKNACFSLLKPTPVKNPQLVAASPSALALLGVPMAIAAQIAEPPSSFAASGADAAEGNSRKTSTTDADGEDINADLVEGLKEDVLKYLSGNEIMDGSETASHCYCGHQFGSFAGQLGDGAAIYLGEVVPSSSASNERWELQLKGAGMTPYSRSADGRKVLRSSLREFIASEYMSAVGVPTTRAATLITSDSRVARDPVYTGEVVMERCSVVSRIAETFIRFGSFEICKPKDETTSRAGPSAANPAILNELFTYVAEEFFVEIANESKKEIADALAAEAKVKKAVNISHNVAMANGGSASSASAAAQLPASTNDPLLHQTWQEVASTRIFAEICQRTAALVAKWQGLGWVHGVLNTDNMSIVGLTIDYGPYGYMTHFDNDHVPNLSDHGGRYSYKQQPAMCQWNLGKLAEAWAIMFPRQQARYDAIIIDHYGSAFNEGYKKQMAAKMGIDYEALLAAAVASVPLAEGASTVEEAAAETLKVEKASAVEDAVMEIIGELVFALQSTGSEMTNTFSLLKKMTLDSASSFPAVGNSRNGDDEPSSLSSSANGVKVDEEDPSAKPQPTVEEAEAAEDARVAGLIADLCITPSARQKILKRRMAHLKPSMHPQQIEKLLQMAQVDPDSLKEVFRANVQTEELIAYLKEEHKKVQDHQRHNAEFIHWMGASVEEKRAKDYEKWRGFLAEYRKTMKLLSISEATRRAVMGKANPVFVPFPWVLQDAIAQAEDGQYSLVRNLVDRCAKPFEEDPRDGVLWKMTPPAEAEDICVSCSS